MILLVFQYHFQKMKFGTIFCFLKLASKAGLKVQKLLKSVSTSRAVATFRMKIGVIAKLFWNKHDDPLTKASKLSRVFIKSSLTSCTFLVSLSKALGTKSA